MQKSFSFIASPDAKVVVLGSFPSAASLERGEYYAHPRNAFWKIMGALFEGNGREPGDYREKKELLLKNRVALWDVLESCERKGSLDSAIRRESMVPNDLDAIRRRAPGLRRVYFNGKSPFNLYRKAFDGAERKPLAGLGLGVLPSTSPAHARIGLEEKIGEWRALLGGLSEA